MFAWWPLEVCVQMYVAKVGELEFNVRVEAGRIPGESILTASS